MNITELDSQYHNYKSLTTDELTRVKNDLIEAIKNKRSEKKLSDLLSRVNDCSGSDLWTFIQELEQFISSQISYERNAFQDRQNEVITTLNKLHQCWNNLNEEQKLTNYWNNAIHNFDKWLKEAENLQLTTDDPFQNFKEDIKKICTADAIELQAQSAKKYILIKFQKTVKQQLGTEQVPNEYREIDEAKDFAAVKMVRNNIKQRRTSHDPSLPSPNKNPEEETPPNKGEYLPNNDAPEKKEPDDNKDEDKNINLPKFTTSAELDKLDLTKVKQIIQGRIESLLTNLRVKLTPNCYKDLCEGKGCWKKYLWENLSDKDKVADFGRKMEKIVNQKADQKNSGGSRPLENNLETNKKNFWIIFIILVGIVLLFVFLTKYVKKFAARKKRKS